MIAKTVRFHEFGGPEVLRFEALEVGEPGADEVRVRIEAIGLNRAEAAFRSGHSAWIANDAVSALPPDARNVPCSAAGYPGGPGGAS